MRFAALDHGAILRAQGKPTDAVRFLIGHPLIASRMTQLRVGSALYAPLSLLVAADQRGGTRLEYDNYDFHVTLDEAEGSAEYNYESAAKLVQAGKIWLAKGELPGMSVFLREGDSIFHTYSTYQRGLDLFLNTYNFLDATPLGRQEDGDRIQAWIRHHDRYNA